LRSRRSSCGVRRTRLSIAFVIEGQPIDGRRRILWLAVIYGQLFGRTFERERGETLKALLLAPASRPAIYVGKLLGMVVLMLALEAVLVPMVAFLFQAPFFEFPLLLMALLVTGTIGFASVGTLFAAMLVRSRARDIMLPILLYPVTIPVIIAGVRGTAALLQSEPNPAMATFWIAVLGAFDVVFVTLALWTFDPLMTDSAGKVWRSACGHPEPRT
jgi:ABC-type transport system involved in cytochrome c biogenesis permease component